jgi:pilus assembly protein CpaF
VTLFRPFRCQSKTASDRIVIGEIRGEEALALIQAMTRDMVDALSTLHASSPLDALAA